MGAVYLVATLILSYFVSRIVGDVLGRACSRPFQLGRACSRPFQRDVVHVSSVIAPDIALRTPLSRAERAASVWPVVCVIVRSSLFFRCIFFYWSSEVVKPLV